MPTLDDALVLAAQVHRGQTDRYGKPYILHPLRVMMRMQTDDEKMVAVLHDVVEDSEMTVEDLREAGYPSHIVEAVDGISRREGESYEAYVLRAKQNPLACRVKIADLEDNMDVRRIKGFEARDFERLKRYRRAWSELTGK